MTMAGWFWRFHCCRCCCFCEPSVLNWVCASRLPPHFVNESGTEGGGNFHFIFTSFLSSFVSLITSSFDLRLFSFNTKRFFLLLFLRTTHLTPTRTEQLLLLLVSGLSLSVRCWWSHNLGKEREKKRNVNKLSECQKHSRMGKWKRH